MVYHEVLLADYEHIRNELVNGDDELIITGYLECMIVHGDSWPEHFGVADVFNNNPSEYFDSQTSSVVVVKPRTESCGKTDGCESGCWRIIGRDKLIKSEETGKILGFKKILKFCKKTKPREYKRSWVMEEYRVVDNLNWKQDHVICKIRLLFETEVSSLLANHFSYLSTTRSVPVPADLLLPAYGYYSPDPQEEGAFYLQTIMNHYGNAWPSYVTNNVYRLHPLTLVDPLDPMFLHVGVCIFANETFGRTGICDGGYWRILHRDRLIKSLNSRKTIGFKKVIKFYEERKLRYAREGEDVKLTWTIEEFRLTEKVKQNKVLCVIKKSSQTKKCLSRKRLDHRRV